MHRRSGERVFRSGCTCGPAACSRPETRCTSGDPALTGGLYKRICYVTGQTWSPEAEKKWRDDLYKNAPNTESAEEEYGCIPKSGGGAWLSRALIESRMSADTPVLRWECKPGFEVLPDHIRTAECNDWLVAELLPLLVALPPEAISFNGEDFGRTGDLTVHMPLLQMQNLDAQELVKLMAAAMALAELKGTRWHKDIAARVTAELASPAYDGMAAANKITRLRQQLTADEQFPVAVLPPSVVERMGVQTQVVHVSDYDLIKQQVSRAGQDFDGLEYLQAQVTLDAPRLVVRENGQMTLFVSDASGKWYAGVLQETATGKAVFLKSFRRSSERDALGQRKKGDVLLDELTKP